MVINAARKSRDSPSPRIPIAFSERRPFNELLRDIGSSEACLPSRRTSATSPSLMSPWKPAPRGSIGLPDESVAGAPYLSRPRCASQSSGDSANIFAPQRRSYFRSTYNGSKFWRLMAQSRASQWMLECLWYRVNVQLKVTVMEFLLYLILNCIRV